MGNALSLVFNSRKPHHTIRTLRNAAKCLQRLTMRASTVLFSTGQSRSKLLPGKDFTACFVQAGARRSRWQSARSEYRPKLTMKRVDGSFDRLLLSVLSKCYRHATVLLSKCYPIATVLLSECSHLAPVLLSVCSREWVRVQASTPLRYAQHERARGLCVMQLLGMRGNSGGNARTRHA
jgi:hypothetical protein